MEGIENLGLMQMYVGGLSSRFGLIVSLTWLLETWKGKRKRGCMREFNSMRLPFGGGGGFAIVELAYHVVSALRNQFT